MLCDAFSELGRLPARPSPVQPGIIARDGSLASKKWLKYANNCPILAQGRRPVFASQANADSLVQLNLNIDTCWKLQLHEGIDGLVRRIDDIHKPFVRPDFVLIAGVLVDMR